MKTDIINFRVNGGKLLIGRYTLSLKKVLNSPIWIAQERFPKAQSFTITMSETDAVEADIVFTPKQALENRLGCPRRWQGTIPYFVAWL